ncbi:hypothetical protein SMICM17S_11288 [Streptomyces microflavus]
MSSARGMRAMAMPGPARGDTTVNVQPISGASAGGRKRRGGSGPLALALGAMLLLVTACGGDAEAGSKGGGKSGSKAEDTTASQAVVTIAPEDGAESVATSGALKITAAQGKLTTVKVADPKGNAVAGEIAADGASWVPERHLAAATKYAVHAVAKDAKGRESAKDTTFTTLVPENTFIGHYTPEDGSTVGVGMPVSINFTRGITEPAAVEKAIKVTADPAVEIEGHWFGNDRLDFRPEKYWAPGTKVTVELHLDGVEGRPGVYGKQARKVQFTIGRSASATSAANGVFRGADSLGTAPEGGVCVHDGGHGGPGGCGSAATAQQRDCGTLDVGYG